MVGVFQWLLRQLSLLCSELVEKLVFRYLVFYSFEPIRPYDKWLGSGELAAANLAKDGHLGFLHVALANYVLIVLDHLPKRSRNEG